MNRPVSLDPIEAEYDSNIGRYLDKLEAYADYLEEKNEIQEASLRSLEHELSSDIAELQKENRALRAAIDKIKGATEKLIDACLYDDDRHAGCIVCNWKLRGIEDPHSNEECPVQDAIDALAAMKEVDGE